MSVHRIVIFNAAGAALYGADLHHGPDHAAAWVAATLARLAAQGIDATALEIDVDEGGDHARTRAIECSTLRLETRANGEPGDVFHTDTRQREGHGKRVLGVSVSGEKIHKQLRGQDLDRRAARWATTMGVRKR